MPSKSLASFVKRGIEAHGLVDFAVWASTGDKDNEEDRRNMRLLCRASVVFFCACWESFVEDLCREAAEHLTAPEMTPERVPKKVTAELSKALAEQKDHSAPWILAGDGWRSALRAHVERQVSGFHTPMHEQVDTLVESTIGLRNVSAYWTWKGVPAARARLRLEKYVKMRGNIAHRTVHETQVDIDEAVTYLQFVEGLAQLTDDAVRQHLTKTTQKFPWPKGKIVFGGRKHKGATLEKRQKAKRPKSKQVEMTFKGGA